MKRIIMRSLAVLFAGVLLATVLWPDVKPSLGQSAKQQQRKMDQNRKERDKFYDRVRQLNAEEGPLFEVLARLDEQIARKESEITAIQEQMVLADKRLLELNGEREQLEEDLDGYEESLADRARAIYMQGDMHYLDVLFGAASFGELVDSVFFIQAIGERDEMLIDTAKQQRVELKQKLDLIETQLSEIEGIKQLLEEQRTELLSAKESKELDLRAIDQDRSLALRQIKEREETNKRIAAKMRRIQAQGTGYTGKPWAGSFDKPCAGTIKSGFGMRTHPIAKRRRMHTGVDISAPRGTAILAAGDGKVVMAERMGGYGKCVIIDHGDGRSTLYGHCSKYTCEVGDVVKKGEKIAEVGSTGYSTGNHLHFEVRINGNPVDPLKQLKQ